MCLKSCMISVPVGSQVTKINDTLLTKNFFHVPQDVEVMQNTLEKRQAKTFLQNLVLYIPVTIFQNYKYEFKIQVYCRNSTSSLQDPFLCIFHTI